MFKRDDLVTYERCKGVVFVVDGPTIEDKWEEVIDDGYIVDVELVGQAVEGHWDCHMYGDDRTFVLEEEKMSLHTNEVCSCGQVGCEAEVYG